MSEGAGVQDKQIKNKTAYVTFFIEYKILCLYFCLQVNENRKKMSQTSFSDLINSSTPVIIDFYADWCAPCRIQSPILEKLKSEMGDAVKVIKIDVDRNPAIAQQLQIMGIPTLMIFQNGKQMWRASGVQQIPVLKKQLEALAPA